MSYPMPYVLMLQIPILFRYGRYVRTMIYIVLCSLYFFPYFFGRGNDCVLDGRVVE